ncbi:MAG TPA: RNA methyltransferase [Trueperaceae bacterium]|nr:RNA methyltransferase [Trueperaceae bacterium]
MARRIDSPSNPLVRALAALKNRREREHSGTFLVEGAREAARAVAAGIEVITILHAPQLSDNGPEVARVLEHAAKHDLAVVELSPAAFERVSLRQHPDGLALQAKRPYRGLDSLGALTGGLVLVMDSVEKPGNVGALLRTAAAVGAVAVVVTGHGTDLENPNVVRASQGSVFAVPVAVAEAAATIDRLSREEVRIVATTPAATAPYWATDYRGSVAVVVGAEDIGLAPPWLAAADASVRIPMHAGATDSLNVSVAAAVVLFEAVRQRSS